MHYFFLPNYHLKENELKLFLRILHFLTLFLFFLFKAIEQEEENGDKHVIRTEAGGVPDSQVRSVLWPSLMTPVVCTGNADIRQGFAEDTDTTFCVLERVVFLGTKCLFLIERHFTGRTLNC